jgi:hypothetical protein
MAHLKEIPLGLCYTNSMMRMRIIDCGKNFCISVRRTGREYVLLPTVLREVPNTGLHYTALATAKNLFQNHTR